MFDNIYTIIITISAVVIVFIFAIEKFTRQIENLTANKFKYYITKFTDTPILL